MNIMLQVSPVKTVYERSRTLAVCTNAAPGCMLGKMCHVQMVALRPLRLNVSCLGFLLQSY